METEVKKRAQSEPNLGDSSLSLSKPKPDSLPGTLDRKRRKYSVGSNEGVVCRVRLLDNTDFDVTVDSKANGQILFDKVCDHVNILEKEYFGLSFQDADELRWWLNIDKRIDKQIKNGPWVFTFEVKFYPPEPTVLQEDITRYQLCLQVRNDIISGKLPCSFVTQALLGSFFVQSEVGDYDPEEHKYGYLQLFQFAPEQSQELELKVLELHKAQKGKSPSEADSLYLRNAKRLAMYGVDCHAAQDSDGVDIMIGVCSYGISIYRNKLRINHFAWPKILKISFLENKFYLKIRPGQFEEYENTVGFKLTNARAAKRLWKVAVEHHTFFRLKTPKVPEKHILTLPRLGSKFRYSGRTHHQIRARGFSINRTAPSFTRSMSQRWSSRSMDELSHFSLDLDRTMNKSQDDKLMKILEEMVMGPEAESYESRRGRDRRPILETSIDSDFERDKKNQEQESFGIPPLSEQNTQNYQLSKSQPNRLHSTSSWEPSSFESQEVLNMFASQEVAGGSYVTESDKFLRARSFDGVLGADSSIPSSKYSYSEENVGRDLEMDKILGKLDVDRFMQSQVATEPNLASQDKVDPATILYSGLKSESALTTKVAQETEDILEDDVFQPPEDLNSQEEIPQHDAKKNLHQTAFSNIPSSLREHSKSKRFHFPFLFGKTSGDKNKNKAKDKISKHELKVVEEKEDEDQLEKDDKKKKKKLFKTKTLINNIDIKDESLISSSSLASDDSVLKENQMSSTGKGSVEIIEIVETEDKKLKEKKHPKNKKNTKTDETHDKESKDKIKKSKLSKLEVENKKDLNDKVNEPAMKEDTEHEKKKKEKSHKKKTKDKKTDENNTIKDKVIGDQEMLEQVTLRIEESNQTNLEKPENEMSIINENKKHDDQKVKSNANEIIIQSVNDNEHSEELVKKSVKEKAAEIEQKLEESKKQNEKTNTDESIVNEKEFESDKSIKEDDKNIKKSNEKKGMVENEKELYSDKSIKQEDKKNNKEKKEKKGIFSFLKIKKKDTDPEKSGEKSKDKKKKKKLKGSSIEELTEFHSQDISIDSNKVQDDKVDINERSIDVYHTPEENIKKREGAGNLLSNNASQIESLSNNTIQIEQINIDTNENSIPGTSFNTTMELNNNVEISQPPEENLTNILNLDKTVNIDTDTNSNDQIYNETEDNDISGHEIEREGKELDEKNSHKSDLEMDFHFPGNSLDVLLQKAQDFHFKEGYLKDHSPETERKFSNRTGDIKSNNSAVSDFTESRESSNLPNKLQTVTPPKTGVNLPSNNSLTQKSYSETDIDFPEEKSSLIKSTCKTDLNSLKEETHEPKIKTFKVNQMTLLEEVNHALDNKHENLLSTKIIESNVLPTSLPLETDLDSIEYLEIQKSSSKPHSPSSNKKIDDIQTIISSVSKDQESNNDTSNKYKLSPRLPQSSVVNTAKMITVSKGSDSSLLPNQQIIKHGQQKPHETDFDYIPNSQINDTLAKSNLATPLQSKETATMYNKKHSLLTEQPRKDITLEEFFYETNIDDDINNKDLNNKRMNLLGNKDEQVASTKTSCEPTRLKPITNPPSPRLTKLLDRIIAPDTNKNQAVIGSTGTLITEIIQEVNTNSPNISIVNKPLNKEIDLSSNRTPKNHIPFEKFNKSHDENSDSSLKTASSTIKSFPGSDSHILDDNLNKTSFKQIGLTNIKLDVDKMKLPETMHLENIDHKSSRTDEGVLQMVPKDNIPRVTPIGSEIAKTKQFHTPDVSPLEIKPHSPRISPSTKRKDLQDARAKFFSQQSAPNHYSTSIFNKTGAGVPTTTLTQSTSPLISSHPTSSQFTTFGKSPTAEASSFGKPLSPITGQSSDSVPYPKTYADYHANKYSQWNFGYPRYRFDLPKSDSNIQSESPFAVKKELNESEPFTNKLKMEEISSQKDSSKPIEVDYSEQVIPKHIKADVIELIPEKTVMILDAQPGVITPLSKKKFILQDTVLSKTDPENLKYNSPERIEINDDSTLEEEKSIGGDSLDEYESAENDKSDEMDELLEAEDSLENVQKEYTLEIDPNTGAKTVTIKTTVFKPILVDNSEPYKSSDKILNGGYSINDDDLNKSFSHIDVDRLQSDYGTSHKGKSSPSLIEGIVSGAPCAKTAVVETVRLRSGSEMTDTDLDDSKDIKYKEILDNKATILHNAKDVESLALNLQETTDEKKHFAGKKMDPKKVAPSKEINVEKNKDIPVGLVEEKLSLVPNQKEYISEPITTEKNDAFNKEDTEPENKADSSEKPLLQSILDSLKGDGKVNVLDSVILKEETEEERSTQDSKESTAEGKEYHLERKEQVKTTKKVTYEKTTIEFTSSKDMKPLLFSGEASAFKPVNQRLDESFSSFERKVETDTDTEKREHIHTISSELHSSEKIIPIRDGKPYRQKNEQFPHDVLETDLDAHFSEKLEEMKNIKNLNASFETQHSEKSPRDSDTESVKSDHLKAKYMYRPFPGTKINDFGHETDIDKVYMPLIVNLPEQTKTEMEQNSEIPEIKYNLVQEYKPEKHISHEMEVEPKKHDSPIYATIIKKERKNDLENKELNETFQSEVSESVSLQVLSKKEKKSFFSFGSSKKKAKKDEKNKSIDSYNDDTISFTTSIADSVMSELNASKDSSKSDKKEDKSKSKDKKSKIPKKSKDAISVGEKSIKSIESDDEKSKKDKNGKDKKGIKLSKEEKRKLQIEASILKIHEEEERKRHRRERKRQEFEKSRSQIDLETSDKSTKSEDISSQTSKGKSKLKESANRSVSPSTHAVYFSSLNRNLEPGEYIHAKELESPTNSSKYPFHHIEKPEEECKRVKRIYAPIPTPFGFGYKYSYHQIGLKDSGETLDDITDSGQHKNYMFSKEDMEVNYLSENAKKEFVMQSDFDFDGGPIIDESKIIGRSTPISEVSKPGDFQASSVYSNSMAIHSRTSSMASIETYGSDRGNSRIPVFQHAKIKSSEQAFEQARQEILRPSNKPISHTKESKLPRLSSGSEFDRALSAVISDSTHLNPDMKVEKIQFTKEAKKKEM